MPKHVDADSTYSCICELNPEGRYSSVASPRLKLYHCKTNPSTSINPIKAPLRQYSVAIRGCHN